MAIHWGVVATWWVGLALGVLLATAARCGSAPKRGVRELVLPVLGLLAVCACCALVSGVTGWLLAESGAIRLAGRIAERVPPDRHVAFLADRWAHTASYGAGLLGGMVLAIGVWCSRRLGVATNGAA